MPRTLEAPPAERAALPLRVAFLGERSRALLGGWTIEVPLERLRSGEGSPLDALVVDGRALGRPELERLCRAARERGARVVGVAGGAVEPQWAGLCDLVLAERRGDWAERVLLAPPAVDPRVINPLGFRHSDVAGLAVSAQSPGARTAPALDLMRTAAVEEPVVLYAPPEAGDELPAGVLRQTPPQGGGSAPSTDGGGSEDGAAALVQQLKERLGVLDHPSLHRSDEERAAFLVRLSAGGVPVAAEGLSAATRLLLGEELSEALEGVSWRELLDLERRERISVELRRAALKHHSLDARWRAIADAAGIPCPPRPKVSVILSTRRESWLAHGLAQVARQNYEPRELVVCLHGDDFSAHVEERLRAEVQGELEIVHVRSDLTLGDALNAGVEVATGDYVTKMDDDDYYSVDHLWDLALALEYSGADLAGKAAEFVYLEDIDLTIRRFMGDTERASERPLAGGGMMARREPLRQLGGWPSRSRGEDTALIKTFRDAGRPLHRTHGYGYILNRHGRDHTWNTYVDYFLVQSQREWRGLRFEETGIY